MEECKVKKAMIMAAGVGSRLGSLSKVVPKPLVPVANIPIMDILLNHLSQSGIKQVIANTFYKAEMIQNRYKTNNLGIDFSFVKENELSGTAGGLKKCQTFFDDIDNFLVMSGDGLTNVNIESVFESHKSSNAIATIVLKEVEKDSVSKYGIVVPNKNGFVESFQEKPDIITARSNLANTGIYIFKRKIFDFIPKNTFFDFAKNLFPILMQENIKINTYIHNGYWSDIGSIEQYKQSNIDVLNGLVSSVSVKLQEDLQGKFLKGKNTLIDNSVIFKGSNVIGNNCRIGKKCILKNNILWDNVVVSDNVTIENSIILPYAVVDYSVKNEIIQLSKKLSGKV